MKTYMEKLFGEVIYYLSRIENIFNMEFMYKIYFKIYFDSVCTLPVYF